MKFDRDNSRQFIKEYNFGPSPRRVAAAKRALKKQREKLPLFASEIAAGQPTPEERIEFYDQALLKMIKRMRDFDASQWREGRAMLRELTPESRKRFIEYWNNCYGPKKAHYLCTMLQYWNGEECDYSKNLNEMKG